MKYLFFLLLVLLQSTALAGVLANNSRVIFNADDDKQTLMIANTNPYPIVVQTWVDNGDGSPSVASSIPLFVTPSTFRLESKQVQALTIIKSDEIKNQETESVYWLNLYEIPPSDAVINDKPKVDLTMNTQHKVFIRPKSLEQYPDNIIDYLSFKVIQKGDSWQLLCKNTSKFHVSFTGLSVTSKGENPIFVEQEMDMMSSPQSERGYTLQHSPNEHSSEVNFNYIDDNGGMRKGTIKLQ